MKRTNYIVIAAVLLIGIGLGSLGLLTAEASNPKGDMPETRLVNQGYANTSDTCVSNAVDSTRAFSSKGYNKYVVVVHQGATSYAGRLECEEVDSVRMKYLSTDTSAYAQVRTPFGGVNCAFYDFSTGTVLTKKSVTYNGGIIKITFLAE